MVKLISSILELRKKTKEDYTILGQVSKDFLNGKITKDELNEITKSLEKRTKELNRKIKEAEKALGIKE